MKWLLDDISKIKTEASWGITAVNANNFSISSVLIFQLKVTFAATFASLAYQNRPTSDQNNQSTSSGGPNLIKDILLLFTFSYAAATVLQYRLVQQVCPAAVRVDVFDKVERKSKGELTKKVSALKADFKTAGKRLQAAEFSIIGSFGNALLISYLSTPASFTQSVGFIYTLFAIGICLALFFTVCAISSYVRKEPYSGAPWCRNRTKDRNSDSPASTGENIT